MDDENPPESQTTGISPLYALCNLFFITALAGIVILISTDFIHGLRPTVLHQHLDSLPLIMIGLAYITLQIVLKQDPVDRLKGCFLGLAFLLWGGEQLLPPSRLVTLMDEGAVTIFVVDVSFIIWDHLNHPDRRRLP